MRIRREFYVEKGTDEKDPKMADGREVMAIDTGRAIVKRFIEAAGSNSYHDRYAMDIVVFSRKEMEEKLGVAHTKTLIAALNKKTSDED